MAPSEIKPYELTNLYRETRHSNANAWTYSLLAATGAIAGFAVYLSGLPHRHSVAMLVWSASLAATWQAKESTRQAARYDRRCHVLEVASEDAQLSALVRSVQPGLPPLALPPATDTFYNWQHVTEEGVGFIIAGNSGSGKSSVATWLAGLLTQTEAAQCLVLDPHYNDIWATQGLASLGAIAVIEATMERLLVELDARCERKGLRQPLGDPLLVIADEIGSCLERFTNPKWVIATLKRLGSEGRKFGMTLIAINQSRNVEDIGISGALRSNYVLILLGAAAREQAKQLGKDYQEPLKGVAYPCIVSGAVEDALAVHPTHGSYRLFKKVGNPPQNLMTIRQLPLTFLDRHPTALDSTTHGSQLIQPDSATDSELKQRHHDSAIVERLNRLYDASSDLSEPTELNEAPAPSSPTNDQALRVRIAELKAQGLNQNQIIFVVWAAKSGGNKAYKAAVAEFKRLTEES